VTYARVLVYVNTKSHMQIIKRVYFIKFTLVPANAQDSFLHIRAILSQVYTDNHIIPTEIFIED